jgi:prepilin-type N-terminal cleavage/methylation domain-containing protein
MNISDTNNYRQLQRGVSLVELMIAMTLALVLSAAVITVFANNRHSYNQGENVQRMQDDARHALREITFEISMAGHYGDLLIPGSVTPDGGLTLTKDCGPVGAPEWMYQSTQAGTDQALSIVALDNATPASAAANFSCITGSEFRTGTDVVSIKRVAGNRSATLTNGQVYLRTNGTVGLLYQEPLVGAPAIPVPVPNSAWEYRPSVFYIRNYVNTPGDGIPTLCKKVLRGANPGMTTECLAAGIEDLQIEYGIDTTDDGFANVYMPSPSLANVQSVVAARVSLLARTTEIDTRYVNDKTFTLSNGAAYSPNDSFHRRVVSTTVSIQNIRSLNAMGF